MLLGSFFGPYLSLRNTQAEIDKAFEGLTKETVTQLVTRLPQKSSALVITSLRRILAAEHSRAEREKILAEYELAADKDLGISKTLTKMGPMLGLMGTLIPMGPALVGLSTGDISSMAYNMQVAFATTVIGISASAIGFITQHIKERWYVRDMSNLEYLSSLINEKNNEKTSAQ